MINRKYYTDLSPAPFGVWVKDGSKGDVLNLACSFDIETTSYYVGDKKYCNMYLWQFSITSGCAWYGRKWGEFKEFLENIKKIYGLNKRHRMIIYVHNLSFECAFLKSVIDIDKIFACEPQKPMYFTYDCFTFKDSYILSGLSLRRTLEECKCPVEIDKTEIDYTLKRHSETPLTNAEIEYGLNDVLGLSYYIETEIQKNGDITKIPLTKTGYARRFVREKCFENPEYKKLIDRIQITNPKIYEMLESAFSGGYTHANAWYVNRVVDNVASIDFTSSYPSVMIRKKYPMSKFNQLNCKKENVMKMCEKFCCVFNVTFTELDSKSLIHTISKHKCKAIEGKIIEDNGRLVYADSVTLTVTNIDFIDIVQFYSYKDFEISDFYFAQAGYLPKEFILCILELYENKCKLKGVEGQEDVYLVSKGILNSLYGMCVTSLVQNNYILNGYEWEQAEEKTIEFCVRKNAKNKRTFLIYAWGVWVTAYARHELFKGIHEIEKRNDFVYSDTDSIKFRNYQLYTKWIDNYNTECIKELESCLNFYGIDPKRINPDNKHPLGVWDFEGVYDKFKTLGCKRYMWRKGAFEMREDSLGNWCKKCGYYRYVRFLNPLEKSCKFGVTVAGLSKQNAVSYILDNGAFKAFTRDLTVPKEHSGRLTHTYLNNMPPAFMRDYLGNKYMCDDKTGVFLEQSEYNLSISKIFLEYLRGLKTHETRHIDEIIKGVLNNGKK